MMTDSRSLPQKETAAGAPAALGGAAVGPAGAVHGRGKSLTFLVSHSSAGGAQEIWADLAEGFLARGFEVTLCALYPYRSEVRETSKALPWRYILPQRPRSPLGVLPLLVELGRYLRRERPDFVLSAMPAANVIGPLVGRLAAPQTQFITSHHSPAQTHHRLLDLLDGLTGSLDNVQSVVSVSRAVADSLSHKPASYLAKRRTITNALPPRIEAHIAGLAGERARRVEGGRRLVSTGRLAAQKNYPVLLRAATLLDDVTFDIVGSGPDEAELKAMAAELGVADKVVFHGQCSRERALEVLAGGDIFVQPSLFEGHSLGLIEAAKLGMPLVVSDVPVQIEGITSRQGERCGIAVDPHDHVALASAIRGLLASDAERARWSQRARILAEGATFDVMIAAYEALIDEGTRRG